MKNQFAAGELCSDAAAVVAVQWGSFIRIKVQETKNIDHQNANETVLTVCENGDLAIWITRVYYQSGRVKECRAVWAISMFQCIISLVPTRICAMHAGITSTPFFRRRQKFALNESLKKNNATSEEKCYSVSQSPRMWTHERPNSNREWKNIKFFFYFKNFAWALFPCKFWRTKDRCTLNLGDQFRKNKFDRLCFLDLKLFFALCSWQRRHNMIGVCA